MSPKQADDATIVTPKRSYLINGHSNCGLSGSAQLELLRRELLFLRPPYESPFADGRSCVVLRRYQKSFENASSSRSSFHFFFARRAFFPLARFFRRVSFACDDSCTGLFSIGPASRSISPNSAAYSCLPLSSRLFLKFINKDLALTYIESEPRIGCDHSDFGESVAFRHTSMRIKASTWRP